MTTAVVAESLGEAVRLNREIDMETEIARHRGKPVFLVVPAAEESDEFEVNLLYLPVEMIDVNEKFIDRRFDYKRN